MNTLDLCILFIHHSDDELTRFHADLIRTNNPTAHFVPLTFSKGLAGAVSPGKFFPGEWPSRNTDNLIYAWSWSCDYVLAKRYVVLEYDTLCTVPICDFYRAVWNEPLAAAASVTLEKNPDWWWFREIPDFRPFGNTLAGIIPLSGLFLSNEALTSLAELARNPLYWPLFCECRVGTMARAAGYSPVRISPDAADFLTWQPRVPSRPGIWHPVKSKQDSV
jgi:hypothetical protein